MQKTFLAGFCCLIALSLSLAAAADKITKAGANANETIDCQGQPVEINSSMSHYLITGECPALTVRGAGNNVQVVHVGKIRAEGAQNHVVWQEGLAGAQPETSTMGFGNSISQGQVEAAPVVADVRRQLQHQDGEARKIDLNQKKRSMTCHGEDVTITGGQSEVRLRGDVYNLTVNGSQIKCEVENVASITVSGDQNEVDWGQSVGKYEEPEIKDDGSQSTIHRIKGPFPQDDLE